jgi:hypothetical protein
MATEGHRHGQGRTTNRKERKRWIKSSRDQSRNGQANIEDATRVTGTLEV